MLNSFGRRMSIVTQYGTSAELYVNVANQNDDM